jgi:carbonic anhydrase/acetyltransferase-like protein (isoleucine patch superfamily)
MLIELSDEELVCLLFWYAVFRDEINVTEQCVDQKLFERLREFLNCDNGMSLKEYVTGTPKYQPGEGKMTRPRLEFTLNMRKEHPENYEVNFGWNSYIHPSVEVPPWVIIGEKVIVHKGVILGSQGFGFEQDESGVWLHIPHIGKLIIEDDVEIFEHCNICRGTVDNTTIGKGTKIDALCHIGHNVKIGKNCIITAHSILGGSSVIGDNVYIGLNSTIIDHASIAKGVFLGQGTNVIKSIYETYSVWAGNPAKFLRGLDTRDTLDEMMRKEGYEATE